MTKPVLMNSRIQCIQNLLYCGRQFMLIGYLLFNLPARGQSSLKEIAPPLPIPYTQLSSDTSRLQYLVKVIGDSLNEGQLTPVLSWSRTGLALAQRNRIDTMQGIFLFYIGKAFTYYYNNYDSAIFYYRQVLPYFPKPENNYHLLTLREIMDRYADLGNKDSSLFYVERLAGIMTTLPAQHFRKAGLSQNIAVVYQSFGMYRTAIRYFQEAISGHRQQQNKRGLGITFANLGELYYSMGDTLRAIQYSREALENLKDVNLPFMQTAANIADYYSSLGRYDSARFYLNISDEIALKINNAEARIANKAVRARIYTALKNYRAAETELKSGLGSLSKSDNPWTYCRLLLSYAELEMQRNQSAGARAHLQEVISVSQQNNFIPFTVQALEKTYQLYASAGDYPKAYEAQRAYYLLRDSLSSSQSKAALSDLEVSYQTQQKEQEIELLKKDNAIKGLKLTANRRSVLFYVAGLLLLLLVLGIAYRQRQQRNRIRFEKLKAELENKVLRLQMNPHFIFNSLNSIENFIMRNEKRLASDYLNKFARLIRMILDSSRDEAVPIARDMEALQLYIDLEQLRFNHKFSYHTEVDPALISGDYRVPSLLIQPFVENAILHGLAHSEKNNLQLSISARLEKEIIRYVIEDNGIGREQARVYNRLNKPQHESIGLALTEARIRIYNKESVLLQPVIFTDITNNEDQPGGTRVEIQIKAA